jgi:hypothetical protein
VAVQIPAPLLVDGVGPEVASHQVRDRRRRLVRTGQRAPLALDPPLDHAPETGSRLDGEPRRRDGRRRDDRLLPSPRPGCPNGRAIARPREHGNGVK